MPNINLTDSRQRDAVVKAENIGVDEEIRYIDTEGKNAYTRKILKATVDHDYDTLVQNYQDDPEKLALALIDGDPEVDMEKCGVFLWGVSKVYVNSDDGIVYRIEQTEIVRDPHGEVKEKRPRKRSEANVDSDIPLTWTGKQIDKGEALRRFVFASKLQIVHVNGLTYDFLYGMATELAENNTLMMLGGGNKGRDPLIFRSGSIPYRGFLEGRVEGDKYILLLHLSNMELKLPAEKPDQSTAEVESKTEKPKEKKEKKAETPVKETKTAAKKVAKKKTAKKKTTKKKTATKKEDVEVVKAAPAEKAKKSTSDNKKQKEEKISEKDKPEEGKEKETAKAVKNTKPEPPAKDQVTAQPKPEVTPESISSEDLGVWLKSVRMGKYLQLFIDNEIDVDVLPELTDSDLKELEIPVGSRRRLLKAVEEIEDLRAEVASSVKKMAKATSGKS